MNQIIENTSCKFVETQDKQLNSNFKAASEIY